jgi:hypothetical protein
MFLPYLEQRQCVQIHCPTCLDATGPGCCTVWNSEDIAHCSLKNVELILKYIVADSQLKALYFLKRLEHSFYTHYWLLARIFQFADVYDLKVICRAILHSISSTFCLNLDCKTLKKLSLEVAIDDAKHFDVT